MDKGNRAKAESYKNDKKKAAEKEAGIAAVKASGAPVQKMAWQDILYAASPALFYTALSSIIYSILSVSGLEFSGIMLQGIALLACLAFFVWYAYRERISIHAKKKSVYQYPASFCYVSAVVMCSVACNYLVFFTGLTENSAGYRHVSDIFYGNRLFMEIIILCMLGPAVEELVYRGFVYQRFRKKGGCVAAMLLSALLFGALHFNLVQGVYAFVLGLLLAYIAERTGSLMTAAVAHMAANLASVLWTETDWLDFLNQGTKGAYGVTIVCLVLTAVFMSYGNQLIRRS